MRKNLATPLVGAVALAAVGLLPLAPASADPAFVPDADDIVGVGSDTTMLAMTYLADGKTIGGTDVPGYNSFGATRRLVSFDAQMPGASTTIVLRQGEQAIPRPNGSTAGKSLLYGEGNNPSVNYARSSSSLKDVEKDAGLWLLPFAADVLGVAVSGSSTNAPATLTPAQILDVYTGKVTNWSELGGRDGAIQPYIPQPGSGTRDFFDGQIKKLNGGTMPSYAASVKETQEHSDVDIKGDPNAIAPFSVGRARLAGTVQMLQGWTVERAVYNVVRGADLQSDWVADIFGERGFLCSPQAKPLIEEGGFDQLASTADGGLCGEAMNAAAPTPLKTSEKQVAVTSTTLRATAPKASTAKLVATVAAGSTAAQGTVEFFEGATKVGSAVPSSGLATLVKTGVPAGRHTYTARFIPAQGSPFTASESAASVVTVKVASTMRLKRPVTLKSTAKNKILVTVTAPGRTPTGYVLAKKGKKVLAKVALSGGKAAVVLQLPKGQHKLRFVYPGKGLVLGTKKVVTWTFV